MEKNNSDLRQAFILYKELSLLIVLHETILKKLDYGDEREHKLYTIKQSLISLKVNCEIIIENNLINGINDNGIDKNIVSLMKHLKMINTYQYNFNCPDKCNDLLDDIKIKTEQLLQHLQQSTEL